ncbi:MAG: glycosyltransferase [Candidatus Omnitrophica bacterium]|nr:glycosyltransferase [Candidatus Omnitrophota bacterium]
MIDKLIFLYSFNGGEIDLPFEGKEIVYSHAVNFLLEDTYFYLLKLMVKTNMVKKVYVVSKCMETSHRFAGYGIYKYSNTMEILYVPNLASIDNYVGNVDDTDLIWTRGTSPVWSNYLVRHSTARKVLYNLAYLKGSAQEYDLIFADDDVRFKSLKRHPCAFPFIKPANEKIFFPLNVEKQYDIISIGTIQELKGQLKIIKAARKLRKPLRLIFPGAIKDQSYLKACRECSNGSLLTVEFPGVVTRQKLNMLINQSRLHVFASRREQVPRVLMEVACAGVPSLVTDHIKGGGQNYITNNIGGICSEWFLAHYIKKALMGWNKSPRDEYMRKFSSTIALKKIQDAFRHMGWI